MLHTEDEARKCWCPFGRMAVAHGPDGESLVCNRGPMDTDCIASQCMAWRWAVAMTYPDNPDTLAERPTVKVRTFPTKALCERFYEQEAERADSGLVGGFCGLAGTPA